MAEVLSQQQIDELLGNYKSGNVDLETESDSSKKVKPYDFMSPKKFSRDQRKLLRSVYEGFGKSLSLQLAGMLRTSCQVEVLQVEEEEFKEYSNALGDNVLMGAFGMLNQENQIEDKQILMEVSRPLSFSILDRLLGGNGSGFNIDRDYTELELAIYDYWFRQIPPLLDNAWSNYVELQHSLDGIETNARMLQSVQPDESVAIVLMEVTMDNFKGNINICISFNALEEIYRVFQSKYIRLRKKTDPDQEKQRRQHIMGALEDAPVEVTALLGEGEISLHEVLGLQVGDVISLSSTLNDRSVHLAVEGCPWFKGQAGTLKKDYAVRISELL